MSNADFFSYYEAQTDVIFDHLASVPADVLHRKDEKGRTINGLLDHQVAVDELYLLRLQGNPPKKLNDYSALSLAQMKSKKHEFMAELKKLFLDESFMAKEFEYTNLEGIHFRLKPSYLLHHLIEHQAHHRGQISLLLRNFDQKPVPSHGYVMHFGSNK